MADLVSDSSTDSPTEDSSATQARGVARARELAEMRVILLFASAEFLDVATTLIGLQSGRFREGNPAAAGLMASPVPVMALKMLVVMAVILLVHRFVSPGRRVGTLTVMATIAIAAVVWNVRQLLTGG